MEKSIGKKGDKKFLEVNFNKPLKYGLYILVVVFVFCFSPFVRSEQGLVGWWKFDEGTGDILHDASGNGNDGKINGAKWIKGKTGSALLFDGKDDFVYCGNDSSLHLNGPLTITTWVNVPVGLPFKDHMIVSKGCWSVKIQGKENDSNKTHVALETVSGDGWGKWHQFNHIECPTYQWVYIVIMHSLEKKKINTYINGELVFQLDWYDTSIFVYDTYSLVFGRHAGANHSYFYGLISDTRIYNRDLTDEEIKMNYELEKKTKDEDLSSFLKQD